MANKFVFNVLTGNFDLVPSGAGTGTVTSVSVSDTNGVSASVSNATTTPLLSFSLGDITPNSVNGLTITANGTNTLDITTGKTLTVANSITLNTNSIVFAGTETLTLAAAKNVTFADAFATSGAHSLTLTTTGDTTVTFPTSGTLVNTAVTTLSSLASVGTITSGVWNATDVPVSAGGTGLSTISALSVWVANSLDTVTEVTPGAGNSIRINAGGTAWEAFTPSSSTPTVITVANEATDTTCFPLFVTAATGDLGPKTNAGLSFNSSTSILTATGFAGPLTGNVTGNADTVTTNANLTGPITSVGNATSIASQTGTGTKFVMDTSPTLVTPVLGVATATSINKVAITAPASSATLTISDGKTLTATQSITLTGTDSTTMTFPSTSATIARTDAGQTFTGVQSMTSPDITTSLTTPSTTFSLVNATATTVNFAGAATTMAVGASTALITVGGNLIHSSNAITASGNAATVPITHRLSTVTNNSAATLTITITTTSAVDGQLIMVRILDSSAVAQTITWVNTEDSTVTAPTTSNGSTSLPLTVGFQFNASTSLWRCVAKA